MNLLRVEHLKDQFVVHTDVMDPQWPNAKRICQEVLGYGEWFGIVEEPVQEQWPEKAGAHTVSVRTLIEIHPPGLA